MGGSGGRVRVAIYENLGFPNPGFCNLQDWKTSTPIDRVKFSIHALEISNPGLKASFSLEMFTLAGKFHSRPWCFPTWVAHIARCGQRCDVMRAAMRCERRCGVNPEMAMRCDAEMAMRCDAKILAMRILAAEILCDALPRCKNTSRCDAAMPATQFPTKIYNVPLWPEGRNRRGETRLGAP